ncbi:MAG: glycosyltransferase [Lentilitoribacter sp.]
MIAFDLRVFSTGASQRGMGRVAREIIFHICKSNPGKTHIGLTFRKCFDPEYSKNVCKDEIFDNIPNLVQHDISDCYEEIDPYSDNRFKTREKNTLKLCNRLHELNVTEYWNLTPFIGDAYSSIIDVPTVGIIYDATPYIYKNMYLSNKVNERLYIEHVSCLRNYDSLISISDTTRSDFVLQFGFEPNKIVTIYPLLGEEYRNYAASTEPYRVDKVTAEKRDYAICVSSHHHSKNLVKLCKAWTSATKRSGSQTILKIILANEHFKTALENDTDPDPNIEFIVNLNEEELFSSYLGAKFCVQPSNYEGFGYPVVEAIALGIPTLANNTKIFEEVGGDVPHFFDANDPAEFEDTLVLALNNEVWLNDLKQRTFSEKNASTSRLISSLDLLVDVQKSATKNYEINSRKKAIAMASSYYPDKCGIVDYVDNIASGLCVSNPTFVVVRKDLEPAISLSKKYIVCSENALDRLKKRWENIEIYYQLGGAIWQYFMWEMMHKHPGTAVFHDLTMGGGLFHISNALDDQKTFRKVFESEPKHRKKIFLSSIKNHKNPEDWKEQIQSTLNGRINAYALSESKRSFVHDDQFKEILLKDNHYEKSKDEIKVVPLAKRDVLHKMRNLNRNGMREAFFGKTDSFVIGLFGNVVPNKLVLEGLKAISLLQKRHKIHIVLIGNQLIPSYEMEILEFIESNGLSQYMTIRGWVNDSDFDRLLFCCDVLLNLRYPANVGMTGPGVQAISAGVAVVVSKEAHWSMFDYQTGESINSHPEHCISEIESALEKIFNRLETVQNSAYSKYQQTLRIEQLVEHYKV